MSAAEIVFYSRGVSLPGVLHLPDKAGAGQTVPGVVLSHGMANNRDEAGQHSYLAARLEESGYAVLRFDFRGCGESGAPRGMMLIGSEWTWDLRAAVTFLGAQPQVDPSRIGAVGSSWGGGVTVFTAAHDRRIRSAVSLGAPSNGERWLRHQWVSLHGETGWQEFLGRVEGNRKLCVQGRPSQTARLLGGFIPVAEDQIPFLDQFLRDHPYIVSDIPLEVADDILAFSPQDYAARVSPTPLLIIHGTADPLVDLQEPRALYDCAREPKELVLVEGGIHQVLSGDTAAPVGDRILDWLARTL